MNIFLRLVQHGGSRTIGSSRYIHISGEKYTTINSSEPGIGGSKGVDRQTGGGGSGSASCYGATTPAMNSYVYSGAGASGTSYSGGCDGQNISSSAWIGSSQNKYATSGSELGGNAGGLLVVFADTITNEGKIESNGVKGIYGNGTGGGSVNLFFKSSVKKGNIESIGGIGGSNGGDGCITITQI